MQDRDCGALIYCSVIQYDADRDGKTNSVKVEDVRTKYAAEVASVESLATSAIGGVLASAATKSFLGGVPRLPRDLEWPERDGSPMSFLAQIDLASLTSLESPDTLPNKGTLFFFYDCEEMPWGFEPEDRDGWKILYSEEDCSELPLSQSRKKDTLFFSQRGLEFALISTTPSIYNNKVVELKLPDGLTDKWFDLWPGQELPIQFFGFANPVQDDEMDLQCQLAFNGVNVGSPSAYKSAKAKALTHGKEDWLLLAQFNSVEEIGFEWGDSGMLYFWIRKEDLAQRNFDNVWMVLQCF